MVPRPSSPEERPYQRDRALKASKPSGFRFRFLVISWKCRPPMSSKRLQARKTVACQDDALLSRIFLQLSPAPSLLGLGGSEMSGDVLFSSCALVASPHELIRS